MTNGTTPKLTSTVALARPVILILPEGKTQGERSHNKGHLFEEFIALLMELHGYEKPTRRNINVTSNGIELDVSIQHRMTKQRAIAECKAYSSNLPGHEVAAFYGKLSSERLTDPNIDGFFVAIPGVTADAEEFSRKTSQKDQRFHTIDVDAIVTMLHDKEVLFPAPSNKSLTSDLAVVITSQGTFSANKILNPTTRLATSIQIWGAEDVPKPVIELLAASDYAAGLPVQTIDTQSPTAPQQQEQVIVEVLGSKSELEYQLPASPKFFVGRTDHVQTFESLCAAGIDQGTVIVLNGQSGWGKSSLALRFRDEVAQQGGRGLVIDSRTASSQDFVWQSLKWTPEAGQAAGAF